MIAFLPSASLALASHRRVIAVIMLVIAASLAGCAGPIRSAFSDPEISVQPPQSGVTPYGLYQPTATRF